MIVLTGPNGNVGTELVESLVRRGDLPYRIAAHRPERIRELYGSGVNVARFDYGDRETWPGVLAGIRSLFLLFPLPHPRTAKAWMEPFVDAAVRAGCKHIVYVSVPGADRYRVIPHHRVERRILGSGVDHTFLRAAYFSQNLCRALSTHGVDIKEFDEIFIPAGNAQTSFVDSRDVAAVAEKVLADPSSHRNRSYVLTGPEQLDFYQVAEIFSEQLGRPIRYARPSFPRFWYRLFRPGLTWDVISFMTIVYTLTRFGKNKPMTSTLADLLGRPPRTMRDFVRDYQDRWTSAGIGGLPGRAAAKAR